MERAEVSGMPTRPRSGGFVDTPSTQSFAGKSGLRTKVRLGGRAIEMIGRLALVSSTAYFASDVIEVAQGRFSTGQL
jgi:hypothetical protein